jgi:hypothetical protein
VFILSGDLGESDLDQHLIDRAERKPGCMVLENMQTGGTAEDQLGRPGSSKTGFQVLEDLPELGLLPETKGGIAAAPEQDTGPGQSIAQVIKRLDHQRRGIAGQTAAGKEQSPDPLRMWIGKQQGEGVGEREVLVLLHISMSAQRRQPLPHQILSGLETHLADIQAFWTNPKTQAAEVTGIGDQGFLFVAAVPETLGQLLGRGAELGEKGTFFETEHALGASLQNRIPFVHLF